MARILVANDDGIDAPGIGALAAALAPVGDVVVVAPDREQSGSAHSLTLHHPLRVKELGPDRFAVQGTPTDCINLGIFHLMKDHRPDLVVSGINHGYNLGDDVTYSGTVAAALEAALLEVPSFAISRSSEPPLDFTAAGEIACVVARQILERGLPADTLLNVNVPPGGRGAMRITRQGRRIYSEGIVERHDPKGRTYFWIGGDPPGARPDPQSDFAAVARGEVSITPLHLDWTNEQALVSLRDWELPFATESVS